MLESRFSPYISIYLATFDHDGQSAIYELGEAMNRRPLQQVS